MTPEHDRSRPAFRRTNSAALVVLTFCSVGAAQETASAPEYRIKAAFLYNFALYTEWPATAFETPESPIVLGVAGDDPFGKELEAAVRGKTVRGRAVEVRRYASATDVTACHVLFISNAETKNLLNLFQRHGESPMLTVGESEDFSSVGGVIRFYVEQNKVRFEVNPDAAARAHIKISSKLLQLAKVVRDPGTPKNR
jgi:hypothetical protein